MLLHTYCLHCAVATHWWISEPAPHFLTLVKSERAAFLTWFNTRDLIVHLYRMWQHFACMYECVSDSISVVHVSSEVILISLMVRPILTWTSLSWSMLGSDVITGQKSEVKVPTSSTMSLWWWMGGLCMHGSHWNSWRMRRDGVKDKLVLTPIKVVQRSRSVNTHTY